MGGYLPLSPTKDRTQAGKGKGSSLLSRSPRSPVAVPLWWWEGCRGERRTRPPNLPVVQAGAHRRLWVAKGLPRAP